MHAGMLKFESFGSDKGAFLFSSFSAFPPMLCCAGEPFTSVFGLLTLHWCTRSCTARSLSRLEPKCMSHHEKSKMSQDICDGSGRPRECNGDCTLRRSSPTAGETRSPSSSGFVIDSDNKIAGYQFCGHSALQRKQCDIVKSPHM